MGREPRSWEDLPDHRDGRLGRRGVGRAGLRGHGAGRAQGSENQRIIGGMAAIGVYGLASFLSGPWDEVQPLLKEMIDKCVRIWEPAIPVGRVLTRDDIEEPITIEVAPRGGDQTPHGLFAGREYPLGGLPSDGMDGLEGPRRPLPQPFPSISASSSVRERLRLRSLQSVYSLADAYHLLDVIRVDAHNRALIEAALRRQTSRGDR